MMASVFTISYEYGVRKHACVKYGKTPTPSTTSTTRTMPSTNRMDEATSSTKLTCPGVSMKCTKCDLPAVVDRMRDIGEDLIDICRSRDRT
jgi:hypothetical protein